MGNVIGVAGKVPVERKISDMRAGEVGYTVPWAYNNETELLNEDFTISSKGGTVSLRVECVSPGKYSLTFETPVYRKLFT